MLNERAEQILWQFPDPIIVLKNNYQVEYANAELEKMLGISLKTIFEKGIHEIGSEVAGGWINLIKKLEQFSINCMIRIKLKR